MKIAFRTDASVQIGTGHVMRCLTLAKALREQGAECTFVCRAHEGHLADKIEAVSHTLHLLPRVDDSRRPDANADLYAHWLGCDWQQDADQTVEVLENDYDWLVVDHYGLDARWETAVRHKTKRILAIDDLANRAHDCDLLLDQNPALDQNDRYSDLIPQNCARLLGPKYALLQPQYKELHPRTPPRHDPVRRILVYFGGSDHDNLTGQTIAAFHALQLDNVVLDVMVSPNSNYAGAIQRLSDGYDNIVLHEPQPSLASLMLKADLAIGAGGTTSWERCCLGLPTLIVTIADNQTGIAKALDKAGAAKWIGDRTTVDEASLTAAIDACLQAGDVIAQSQRCLALVDGKGQDRLTECMLLDRDTELVARLVHLDDEALLLGWANDQAVRQNAYASAPITAETHRDWFHERLRSPEVCAIYIVETTGGVPVGQARFELNDNDEWEIDYSLDTVARGHKLGAKLLQLALSRFREDQAGALVFGQVKQNNIASKRVFERLGFSGQAVRGGGIVYRHLL